METHVIDAPTTTGALSFLMQSIARNYLAARARAGEAILDSARYLAEAREAAKYGEWKIFLEATGTPEDTATRMIAIANRAEADRQYAVAVRDGRLAFTAAFELLSAPEETQRIALESSASTPATVIRKAKQEEKLRTSAEFQAPAAPKPSAINRPDGSLSNGAQPVMCGQCGGAWGAPGSILVGGGGFLCATCVRANGRAASPSAAPIETDDQAIITEIRTKAEALGLGLIWEDDTVILHWPDEDIEQLMGMGYQDALYWLAGEGAQQAEQRAAKRQAERPPAVPPRPRRPVSADVSAHIAYTAQLEVYASALETFIMELQRRCP